MLPHLPGNSPATANPAIQPGIESVDRKNIAMNNRREVGRGAGTVVLSPSGDVIVDLLPILAVGNASVLRKSGRSRRVSACRRVAAVRRFRPFADDDLIAGFDPSRSLSFAFGTALPVPHRPLRGPGAGGSRRWKAGGHSLSRLRSSIRSPRRRGRGSRAGSSARAPSRS
jgi:hypothetical protein